LPPDIRLAVYRRGHLRDVDAGESLGRGCGVQFILSGALGLFPLDGSGICLRLAGPGAVVNAEEMADAEARRDLRVLVKGALLALRGPDLVEIIGRSRADQLVVDQMLAEQAALDREVACNALHLAPARLARWLVQLGDVAGGDDIRITQAELAHMLGVQRTSINAAARCLHGQGGLRFVRGRLRILDPGILARQACECLTTTRAATAKASSDGEMQRA
ncbi:MAG: Crp/Fnr family transcriptional regulator, partial [Brevundimonas sp.]